MRSEERLSGLGKPDQPHVDSLDMAHRELVGGAPTKSGALRALKFWTRGKKSKTYGIRKTGGGWGVYRFKKS